MNEHLDSLAKYVSQKYQEIVLKRDQLNLEWKSQANLKLESYFLPAFRNKLHHQCRLDELADTLGLPRATFELVSIDRQKFGADLALKIPTWLKALGNKEYLAAVVPQLMKNLSESAELTALGIKSVAATGFYINILLLEDTLFDSLSSAIENPKTYGTSNSLSKRSIVIDYSSPNAAKNLHAGHIRSTILGHVLYNLLRASGAQVYGLNYLNDWGGMGQLLEGYLRWQEWLQKDLSGNALLVKVYSLYRRAEQSQGDEKTFSELTAEEIAELQKAFGAFTNRTELATLFQSFLTQAQVRFRALESGEPAEVSLWQQLVQWSLEDFEQFYDLLKIHINFLIGESFFARSSSKLVHKFVAEKKVFVFSSLLVEREIAEIEEALKSEKIKAEVAEHLIAEAKADEGAYIVPLSNFQRFVIMRADGASVYSTRDTDSLLFRKEVFSATDLLYVVGQEQGEHFQKLFASAEVLGLIDSTSIKCHHFSHGFYIDAVTKKKLSSRQGAQSVIGMLQGAIDYFRKKYTPGEPFTSDEIDSIAKKLAVGSIVLNDIKKDRKSSVDIHPNAEQMYKSFEDSGGAYFIYTVCRARSLLDKWDGPLPTIAEVISNNFDGHQLEAVEVQLIKLIFDFPETLLTSAETYNPSALVSYLQTLAQRYNTYYANFPVLKGGVKYNHRAVITKAVATTLENGLRFCHIDCPARI